MNERGVQRTVWVYEEDLTIRWTNADNPEDILEVTLHAIGTNDGVKMIFKSMADERKIEIMKPIA